MFILSICQFLSGIDICLSQVLARQVVDGYPVFLPSWKHEIDDCVIADVDQGSPNLKDIFIGRVNLVGA